MTAIKQNWVADQDKTLIRKAMRAEMLARDVEHQLARDWREKGDAVALSRLTNAYLRLVVAMASKFKHYGIPVADLIQEGSIGLLEAASRFDTSRDVRFSTYATWWVRAAMQDFVLRNWSIVRTGTTSAHKSLFFNLKRLKVKLGLSSDKPLSLEGRQQIASNMGVREVDVNAMEGRLTAGDRSLNARIADDSEQEWQDMLVSDAPQPDELVEKSIDADKRTGLIRKALAALNPRERMIIQERRLREEGATLAALGKRLGVSKERVRQLEAQAMKKLRTTLMNCVGDPVDAGLVAG